MDMIEGGVDVFFDLDPFGRAALYRAGGVGAGIGIRVITQQPDVDQMFGETRARVPSTVIDVRISEVATPAEGDTFEIDGVIYTVDGRPKRDAERLTWSCGCQGG